jgi:AraC family transcriptional regulator
MEADIVKLFSSPIASVHNFMCRCQSCAMSRREHAANFTIAFIRRGTFRFNVFRNELDAYHGHFLINKPYHEYTVSHIHDMPDQCTVFSISESSLDALRSQTNEFAWFFNNPDTHSLLVSATPATEFLHYQIFQMLQSANFPTLWVETLITELLVQVLSIDRRENFVRGFNVKQKKHYLPLVEKVKEYMNQNLEEDLSLATLADKANLSVFHFNRLFKKISGTTPYRYLLEVRLQQAQLIVRNTSDPITDIAFACGFTSLEHFSTTYRKYFGKAPCADRL